MGRRGKLEAGLAKVGRRDREVGRGPALWGGVEEGRHGGGLAGLAPLVVPELLVPSILARQDAAPLISTLQPLPIHHYSGLISRRRRPHPQLWAEQLPFSLRWPPPLKCPLSPSHIHFPPQNVGWAQPPG